MCRLTYLSLLLIAALAPFSAQAEEFDENFPVVLTPARLKQSIADAPASVTVLTAETLKKYGITSIPEALRLVPGMEVQQATGSDYRVNYHGGNILVPRRMNVLVDGVSLFRPGIARVDWAFLPISIEDVDRIEVTRGPNSVTYGSNSLQAVINIITKHPDTTLGSTVSVGGGSQNSALGYARYSGRINDSTTHQISISRDQNSGFDRVQSGRRQVMADAHDSVQTSRFNYRIFSNLGNDQSIDFKATFLKSSPDFQFIDSSQITFPDAHTQDVYFSALYKKTLSDVHEIQVLASNYRSIFQQEWRTCPPLGLFLPELFALWRANPAYATTVASGRIPTGGTRADNALALAAVTAIRKLGPAAFAPTCADGNQNFNEERADIELQDIYTFSDQFKLVSGFGAKRDSLESGTYLGGKVSTYTFRAFANTEFKPVKSVNINVGAFFEKNQISGFFVSPRAAINWHITPESTLRFILSRGGRAPDTYELKSNWTYQGTNLSVPLNGSTNATFYQNAQGNPNLKPDRIFSREIGYNLNLPRLGLSVDAKLFDDHLTDLISEKNQLSDFRPTNKGTSQISGFELQANYSPSSTWSGFLALAYIPTNEVNNSYEFSQYSKTTASAGINHKFDDNWSASLAQYQFTGNGTFQSSYGRTDLTVSKLFKINQSQIRLNLSVRHLSNRDSTVTDTTVFGRTSSFNSSYQYFAQAQVDF